jgi:hypothetical protein
MPEDIFRVVITAAVVLACIAFLIQAFVVLALYRTAKRLQLKVDELAGGVAPLIAKAGPVIDKMGPVVDKSAQVIGQIGLAVEQAGPVMEGARLIMLNANQLIADTRPRIAEFSDEAVGAARSGREQVERIGDLLSDVSDRAHARLEQIDQSVENTVEQVGQVGDAMKRAVLRPVREANGIAAGISAAVSTLVKPRKSSPDAATQDEEMFI